MKYYNIEGYVRHKKDLEEVIHRNEKNIDYDDHGNVDYTNMTDNSIIN